MPAATVLVVDDDLSVQDVVSRMLKCEGYEVLLADGPRDALEILKNNPPVDLVVSDIAIPEMEGTQLIREVAQLSPQTAAVLMTGSLISAVDAPVGVPVLEKPFSPRDLITAVHAVLARSVELLR